MNLPKILCPSCNTGMFSFKPGMSKNVDCTACNTSYSIKNGILNLLPESPSNRKISQRLMEWEPLIEIYESALWRKNYIFTKAFLGISFDEEFETVVNAAKLSENDAILDLACGPGIYSRPLAKRLKQGSVSGLDLSLPMLNYAASSAHKEEIKNFIPIYGNALNLPFPENQFDAVICCGAFHLFPDHDRVLSEIKRVLKPEGRFVAAVFYRRIPGAIGKSLANFEKRINGIYAFRPDELKLKFLTAGLVNIEFHHAIRAWMIVSGVKRDN